MFVAQTIIPCYVPGSAHKLRCGTDSIRRRRGSDYGDGCIYERFNNSSSSIDQPSDVTAAETLTWNKAILLDCAEFKRVDPENEVMMLKNNYFKCVLDPFVIDSSKKTFSIVFTPFLPPHKRMTNFFNSGKTAIRDSLPTFIIRLTE